MDGLTVANPKVLFRGYPIDRDCSDGDVHTIGPQSASTDGTSDVSICVMIDSRPTSARAKVEHFT